jgi:hypothetical protein
MAQKAPAPAAPSRSTKDILLFALRKGNADKVRHILTSSSDSAEINPDMAADSAMNCLLHRAARYGHKEVVKASVFCYNCEAVYC